MSDLETPSPKDTKSKNISPKQKRILLLVTLFFLVIIVIYFIYWLLVGHFYEDTDNAYVNGNIIPITSQVGGTVIAIKADDTQFVTSGQVLIKLDPIDSYVAYEQAKANLITTLRTTQQLFIKNTSLQANITNSEVSYEKARKDLSRRNAAIGLGAVSKEELTHASDNLKSSAAALTQAQSAAFENRALTENTTVREHPNVKFAAANLRQAYINYLRSTIKAPVAGEISKRSVQIGQRIAAGTLLMALVPLDQVWVDANFKEKQVRFMRLDQPVTLTADLYGSSVVYHGKIVGFSAGTGSAFSLLPAQNATGNWIKIVQRLPVRIALDVNELKKHPLRIGLSMEVSVNLHDNNGKLISQSEKIPTYETKIYEEFGAQADKEVSDTITDSLNKTSMLQPPPTK